VVLDADELAGPEAVGEIQVRSPGLMSGYHRNPEATARALEGGWLRTGDLGRLDADGHLFLVGRRRDVINHGGFSVYPDEVDQVLEAHPAVRESATLERASAAYGEVPVSFVVLERDVSPDELREHCRENLAPYKVPVEIIPIERLPRGATRKLRKDLLHARLVERERGA
jgi:acyl-CoA synthetase (AMP-forming)/AMP-acid ligase II